MSKNRDQFQHYVPRFMLKRFAANEAGDIWMYDMKMRRSRKAHINRVAAQHGYYDFTIRDIDQDAIDKLASDLGISTFPVSEIDATLEVQPKTLLEWSRFDGLVRRRGKTHFVLM
jgi:hypothetical protein